MSEELTETTPQPDPAAIASPVSSIGETLAAAREQAGMSVEQVASKLRLSVRQIRALEEGDAIALPDPTFVRGFLRNYAKLVGLDVDPLLKRYAAGLSPVAAQSISLPSENIRISGQDRVIGVPYLLGAGLVILAVVLWVLLMGEQKPAAPATPETPVAERAESSPSAPAVIPAPAVAAMPVEAAPLAAPAAVPADATVQVQAVPAPAVPAAPTSASVSEPAASAPASVSAPTPAPAPAVAAAPGTARLEMNFSQSVWLSVHDRDGKQIYNNTRPANSQDVVEGVPPLQIVIGNAGGISLSFKGKPVDLAPHTRANVARLTLE